MSLIDRSIAVASGIVAFLLLALVPASAAGQRNSVSLEADLFRSTLGYARQTAPDWQVGFETGYGSPQLDQTLIPGDADLSDEAYLGLFVRCRASEHLNMDAGLRLQIADLRECGGSDCLPGLCSAFSGSILAGWRSVRFGPRLTVGRIREAGEPITGFVVLSPVNLLLLYSW